MTITLTRTLALTLPASLTLQQRHERHHWLRSFLVALKCNQRRPRRRKKLTNQEHVVNKISDPVVIVIGQRIRGEKTLVRKVNDIRKINDTVVNHIPFSASSCLNDTSRDLSSV